MKNIISIVKKSLGLSLLSLAFIGCQEMDRPELGNFPKDANVPGGPLKFYTAFNGETTNPLINAVDSIRAKFPLENKSSSIDGINGKAVQGEKGKYIKYSSANDFVNKAESFTIAFWEKRGEIRSECIFSLPAVSGFSGTGGAMYFMMTGTVEQPIVKFFIRDSKGFKWFEWFASSPTGGFLGVYDAEWHSFAIVYDASISMMTLYRDGVAGNPISWDNHGAITLDPTKITSLVIGAGPKLKEGDAEGNSWTGGIDQFRMYGTALTAAEIQELYSSKK